MIWKFRSLNATDWDAWYEGFASQVLWVGTTGQSVIAVNGDFVEVGATNGWQGQDLTTFYSAEVDNDIYQEARLVGAGALDTGTQYTFRVVNDGGGLYRAQVDGPSSSGSVVWGGHYPYSIDYAGGLEATCHNNKVNATYVSNNKFRRYSDGAFY
jgi:hypothetical protein